MSIVYAILGLGVLIVVHELGHMLVARSFGMRVDRFSVGFGPALARWYGNQTTYQIALIPLGGFVQIAGMNPHEELPEGDPGSYANKPAYARFLTILAGPLVNYIFAILIMAGVFLAWGYPNERYLVGEVLEGAPAAAAGMQSGDEILTISGKPAPTRSAILAGIEGSGGKPLNIKVRRGEAEQALTVTPAAQEDGSYKIGIGFAMKLFFTPMEPGKALLGALYYPVAVSQKALSGLGKVFTGKVSTKRLGGPPEIVRQLKMAFEEGIVMAIIWLGMLNVYLGLFNLLPVPALDGGRLVFLGFTLITRKAVNQRIENMVHTVGFIILLGLILLLSFQDVMRFVGGP